MRYFSFLSFITFIHFICFSNGEESLNPEELENILRGGDVRLLDLRGDYDRQMEGFISGSEIFPFEEMLKDPKKFKNEQIYKPIPGDNRRVIYVAREGAESEKARNILKTLKFDTYARYTSGISAWVEAFGNKDIDYPKFIEFHALQDSLASESVLLLDVRNRTELNTVGQIPGSVCVPLHEIGSAFLLDNKEFENRYGFRKPGTFRKDIVLTCRSGKRVLVADEILKKQGYNNLRIYSGSFKDWVKNQGSYDLAKFDLDYEILN